MKIAITGAHGQLGWELQRVLASHTLFLSDLAYRQAGLDILDITDQYKVDQWLATIKPDWVIHAAAYTAVDAAQGHRKQAFAVNEMGSRYVAQAANAVNANLIAISTDYVFDGIKTSPYVETDTPHPINVYGASKLAGEQAIQAFHRRAMILRTAWLYGGTHEHKNFVRAIVAKAQKGESLRVVDDQVGSPTYARHLAIVIGEMMQKNLPAGLYHAVNGGATSWYGFAQEILKIFELDAKISPLKTASLGLPAPRPAYSVLSTKKLSSAGISMPTWQQGLKEFANV